MFIVLDIGHLDYILSIGKTMMESKGNDFMGNLIL